MIKWEYRVEARMADGFKPTYVGGRGGIGNMTEAWLNEIGNDGWELMGITTHVGDEMNTRFSRTSDRITLTFKRPVRDELSKQSAEGSDVIAELQELHNMRQINIEPPKLPIPDKPPFE